MSIEFSEPARPTSDATEGPLSFGALTLDVTRRSVDLGGKPLHVTPSEFALMYALLERPGFVRTRAQLVQRLPDDMYPSPGRSIDVYLRNIRRKLEPCGLVLSYVETVFGAGYRVTLGSEDGGRLL